MEIKNNFNRLDPYLNRLDLETPKAEPRTSGAARQAQPTGDTVSLSSAGLKAAAARSAQAAPEVRQEKITAIKARIDSGEYRINSRDIAENILRTESELFGA